MVVFQTLLHAMTLYIRAKLMLSYRFMPLHITVLLLRTLLGFILKRAITFRCTKRHT